MLNQLVQQLQGSLVLPACLRLVGLLRRMSVFNETELRLKFLQVGGRGERERERRGERERESGGERERRKTRVE